MNEISPNSQKFFQKQLLDWFAQHQRDLPWRRTYTPYHVWVSEIMLQQTQVKTVLPYFERWVKTLPTIKAVARASEEKILKLWEGLGYYSRARNVHKAAKIIVEKHNGKFPGAIEQIRALPGIGRYTAGAIASIAFSQNEPLVDGNVIRVLSRLTNDSANTRESKVMERYWHTAEQLIPLGRARYFNQAIMEFGALICTPKNPACDRCPIRSVCKASKAGTVENLPNRGKATEKIPIRVAIAVIRHPDVFKNPIKPNKFFIQKRRHKGLMGGLWEFPGGKLEPTETPEKALHREIKEEIGITLKSPRPILRIKHAYTKYAVDLHCFLADYKEGKIRLTAAQDHRWVTIDEMKKLAFPAANVKIINHLRSLDLESNHPIIVTS